MDIDRIYSQVTSLINQLGIDATFSRTAKTNSSSTPITTTVGTAKAVRCDVVSKMINTPTPNNSQADGSTINVYIAGKTLIPKVGDKVAMDSNTYTVASVERYLIQSMTIAIKVGLK